MTYDGGGWTLIASSNGVDTTGPVVSSLTSTTASGILNSTNVVALANIATAIRITQGAPSANGAGFISTASATLNKLKAYQILNNSAMQGVNPNTDWTPSVAGNNMYFSGAPGVGYTGALSAAIYHASGNGTTGLHWCINSVIKWSYPGAVSNLNLCVK